MEDKKVIEPCESNENSRCCGFPVTLAPSAFRLLDKEVYCLMVKRYKLFKALYPDDFDAVLLMLNYQAIRMIVDKRLSSKGDAIRWIERGLYQAAKQQGLVKCGTTGRWRRSAVLQSELQ